MSGEAGQAPGRERTGKMSPQDAHAALHAALARYDLARNASDTRGMREGVRTALAVAREVLERAFPDGTELVRPLLDLNAALQQFDEGKTCDLLLRTARTNSDLPASAHTAKACAIADLLEKHGGMTRRAARAEMAKRRSLDAARFDQFRRNLDSAGRTPEGCTEIFNEVKRQIEAQIAAELPANFTLALSDGDRARACKVWLLDTARAMLPAPSSRIQPVQHRVHTRTPEARRRIAKPT